MFAKMLFVEIRLDEKGHQGEVAIQSCFYLHLVI